MHSDVFFYIWVIDKLNYFNMAVKSKMTAIEPFEGLYALVIRAYINHWSINDAYYATEVKK